MPKGPDPRLDAAPLTEVPRLLAEGAALYNARRFWHAHEAWEAAWHSLRVGGQAEGAAYLQGMILVTAALENATRGREEGFKRQFAEALHRLHAHPEGATGLGLRDPRAWERALVQLYADACRQLAWSTWNARGWIAPAVVLG